MINFNLNSLIRDNIKTIKPYSSARDEYKDITDGMVFIDANENPFNTGVNRYPDPQQTQVKKRLSELKGIPTNQILLGNGSDEVLDLIFRVFCEPYRENIITLPPTYGMYDVLANLNAVDNIEIELESDFQPNIEEILTAAHTHTKLLFLCSPNNPTANSFKAKRIEELINEFQGIVVIDEAYIDFSKKESWLSRLDEFPNLIITQTLSKAYGLAGIRLGICYASQEIISVLNKIKPPYNINQLSQDKALERLNAVDAVYNEMKTIITERKKLRKALKSIRFIEKVYPSDANFILVKVDDANQRYQQLVEQGIVVRNRTNQPLCDNCLRFSVGTEAENEKLIKTLIQLL
ncbi:Histidinol-phosphate aminotransferase [Winogradskyella psychrotolerans RS-3]|uniref:Histidinol-phosphate aminotransferase n=1 Tax=Winogradskyella psychrotolerans RS-3 TaxID=641526 RepID=S7X2B9_9FLAO|nr:histidinol-phosphate transaminase [Winogradskyella psychrotolerans]EPR70243.1 Histidinol-phosphate aminotransferase [Winogradskyella psychrotolerans RS-3]